MFLDVGDQQMPAARVPGESVRLWAYADAAQRIAREQVQHQDPTRAARGGKHQSGILRAQYAARLGTARYRAFERLALAVDDIDRAVRCMRNKDTPTREVDVAVIEAAGGVLRQFDERLQCQHRAAELSPAWPLAGDTTRTARRT